MIGLSIGLRSVVPLVGWVALLTLAIARDAWHCRQQVRSTRGGLLYALHHYLSKVPIVMGHLAYYRRHLFGGRPLDLIEYRSDAKSQTPNATTVAQANEGSP